MIQNTTFTRFITSKYNKKKYLFFMSDRKKSNEQIVRAAEAAVKRYDGHAYDWLMGVLRRAVGEERKRSRNRWPKSLLASWEGYQRRMIGSTPHGDKAILEVALPLGLERHATKRGEFKRDTDAAREVLNALIDFNTARDAAYKVVSAQNSAEEETSKSVQRSVDSVSRKIANAQSKLERMDGREAASIARDLESIQRDIEGISEKSSTGKDAWTRALGTMGLRLDSSINDDYRRQLINAFSQLLLASTKTTRKEDIGCDNVVMSCAVQFGRDRRRDDFGFGGGPPPVADDIDEA